MSLKPGSIVIFSNHAKDFFTVGQKLFTHEWLIGASPKKFKQGIMTHAAIVWFPEAGEDALFEAKLATTIRPFAMSSGQKHWIYELQGFTDDQIKETLYEIYKEKAGSDYGFLEIPWFIYRYFMELFHKDVRKQHTWFPGGNICSQDVWYFLEKLATKWNKPDLAAILNEWRSTTFHASDVRTVAVAMPKYFKLTYSPS
jgi:hypothetical protein